MTRHHRTYGGEGPTEGSGPLSGSADSHIDHEADRDELWGDVREWAEETEPPDEPWQCECGRSYNEERKLKAHRTNAECGTHGD